MQHRRISSLFEVVGGGSGSVGSLLRGDRGAPTAAVSPPPTNRGVSTYRSEVSGEQPSKICFGGYDGGTEVGFEVEWDESEFTELKEVLQRAKDLAGESGQSELVELGEYRILVDASGANAGLHYRFKFSVGGVTFMLHHNPPQGRQGVRVRYGATALIGRSLFDVHAKVLGFLSELGCTVTKEIVSRVDMQVTLEVDCQSLLDAVYGGCAVSKVRNDVLYRSGGKKRTYVLGQRGRLQECMYDKSAECKQMAVSNPAKFQLLVDEHLGADYTFERSLTRVEFRLWRDVLRLLEVNTVEDLRVMETSIVSWLTSKWFRVLSSSKVRGHENTAALHADWVRIQEAFVCFFPGLGREVREITFDRDRPVTCEASALERQALGCLKSALALSIGAVSSMDVLYAAVCEWVDGVKHELFCGVNERVERLQVSTGVSIAEIGRRKAREFLSKLNYERGSCFG